MPLDIPTRGRVVSHFRTHSRAGRLKHLPDACRQFGRRHQLSLLKTSLVFLLALSCAIPAFAKNPDEWRKAAKKFKKGDKVEVTRFDKKSKGVVTEITGLGQVRVATKEFPHSWPYEPDKVRLLSRKDKASTATGKEANPFATDEEKYQEVGKRTWSDRSGKFRIEATIVRIDGGKVVLKRTDNKEITVDRAKLSDEDQAILNKVAGSSEGEETSADEFPEVPEIVAGPDIELTETDLATATPLDLGAAGPWTYSPDPDPTPRKLSRVALPKLDFWDEVERVIMPSGTTAYLVVAGKDGSTATTSILACDLEKRKLSGKGSFYSNQLPLDVSPDGKKLLSRSHEFGFGKNGTMYLYELDGFKTTPLASWEPYGNERGIGRDVEWATFVDNDHLLTLSRSGVLALWDSSGKIHPVYSANAGQNARAILSGSRKYLFVRTETGIAVINPLKGESAGFIEAPGGWQAALALHPDGNKLAIVDWGRVRVWNLQSRELERDFSLADGLSAQSIAWCDPDRIVTNHGDLIDVDRRVKLWRYTGCDSPISDGGGGVWAVVGKNSQSGALFVGSKLPHGDVVRAAEKLDPDTLLVIRPGLEVNLRMNFSGTAEQQQRVKDALTKRLEDAGMRIVPQSPVALVATIKAGKPTKVQYRAFNSSTASEHTVPQQILELSYTVNGKPVWTYSTQSWAPHWLELQQGETIDQALVRATKQNPEQFESIFVPAYVAAGPPEGPGQSPWPGG